MLSLVKSLSMFEAVIRNSCFTKAADEHKVTSLEISEQIKKLERHLGVTLLTQSDPSIVLTEEGSTLYKELAEANILLQRGIGHFKSVISPLKDRANRL